MQFNSNIYATILTDFIYKRRIVFFIPIVRNSEFELRRVRSLIDWSKLRVGAHGTRLDLLLNKLGENERLFVGGTFNKNM